MKVKVKVNGKAQEWEVGADEFLADTLRRFGYTSVKTSCLDGVCGSCTVFVDEKPMLSCEYPSARIDGKAVTTIEGVKEEAEKVSRYLVEAGGEGCGYCAPGFVMLVIAMKRELDHPTYDQVRAYLDGNLCRCTGYVTRNEAALAYMNMDQ